MPRRRSPRIVRRPQLDHDVDGFQVGPDTVVTLVYSVRDEDGELVEDVPAEPLAVVFGYGQLLPAIEAAAQGLVPGDRVTLALDPESAWGAWDPGRVIEVDRAEVPADAAPGDVYEAEHDGGAIVLLKVLDVRETTVLLDTNHPLAGQRVSIEFEVRGVRPATEEELERAAEAAPVAERPAFDVALPRLLVRGGRS